jgi:hypothetical protein
VNSFSEITRVLSLYFDTLYCCDLDKFDMVFHEKAIYATADEAVPLFRDMSEYRRVIAKRTSPLSANEPRLDFIDSIELAGKNTARVRARCAVGSRDFVDFLTLICDNGQWRIISKIFQIIDK